MKTISRSDNRSATAAAAYRAGCRLVDQRSGQVHDYRRRRGVEADFLVLPGTPGVGWADDRSRLWNAAEMAETRRNSTVAREYELALPAEVDMPMRWRLAETFARLLCQRYGIAAHVALHAPSAEGDKRNWHAHVLTTTRVVTAEGFGAKTRVLDSATTGAAEITTLRAEWAAIVNQVLKEHGHERRIDHRSLEARGLMGATEHLGPGLTAVERRRRREAREAGTPYTPGTGPARRNAQRRALRNEIARAVLELRDVKAAEETQRAEAAHKAQEIRQAAAEAARKAEEARQDAERREKARQAAQVTRKVEEARLAAEQKAAEEQQRLRLPQPDDALIKLVGQLEAIDAQKSAEKPLEDLHELRGWELRDEERRRQRVDNERADLESAFHRKTDSVDWIKAGPALRLGTDPYEIILPTEAVGYFHMMARIARGQHHWSDPKAIMARCRRALGEGLYRLIDRWLKILRRNEKGRNPHIARNAKECLDQALRESEPSTFAKGGHPVPSEVNELMTLGKAPPAPPAALRTLVRDKKQDKGIGD